MGFAEMVQAPSEVGSLRSLIKERYVETWKVPYLTVESFVRASGFAKLCAREEVLCAQLQKVRDSNIDASLNLIFLHGKGLHWAVQNNLLAETELLLGVWRCTLCGKLYGQEAFQERNWTAVPRRPKVCLCKGDPPEFVYVEQALINEQYRLTGHPDGFLVLPGLSGVGILEVKSITKGWEVKNVPQFDHVIQCQLYMWMTGLQWARILYWEKGAMGMSALIEHHVPYDPVVIDRAKAALTALWDGLAGKGLPARICETPTCPRAGKCAVPEKCFEPEF